VAISLVGCGASDDDEEGVSLTVTRDFGRVVVDSARLDKLPDDATALGVLRSEIDAPVSKAAYFVNGVRPDVPAADYELAPGDRVQWDAGAAPATRAIVGSFPEPFLHGLAGERRPVRVECDEVESDPCRDAKDALEDAGVPVSGSSLGAPGTENVTRLVVAPWSAARIVRGGHTLEAGPEQSGVYARFAEGGTALELLDEHGEVARRAAGGTALIAALRPRADELVWIVTALDQRGLAAGAKALRAGLLRNAFAVAVTGSKVEKLPL
jgi:hypothetical protein